MTRVALLRHYPTDWNGEARLQGQTDRPLTEAARETLRGLRLPPAWEGVPIITSALSRTVETARLLGREPQRQDPRLNEVSWGDWEGHRAADLLADPASGFRPTAEMGWRDRPPGGESMADAWGRIQPALAEIEGPALLVLHKAVMRIILGTASAWREMPEIKRGRLYPLVLRPSGLPVSPEPAIRLVAR